MRRISRRKMSSRKRTWLIRSVELVQKISRRSQAVVTQKYEGMEVTISKIVENTTLLPSLYFGEVFFNIEDDIEEDSHLHEVPPISFFDDGKIAPSTLAKKIAEDLLKEIDTIMGKNKVGNT